MFRVRWSRHTLSKLTDLWTNANAAARSAITAATSAIDQMLAADPKHAGESRFGGRRILIVYPLAVLFRVSTPQKTAYVVQVHLMTRRRL